MSRSYPDATVTLAIERALPGRLTRGRCGASIHGDPRDRPCTRLVTMRGTLAIMDGVAGRRQRTTFEIAR